MSTTLPLEIWSQIFSMLPKFHLPPLLSVCTPFHDIVIRNLFSSIKIYFISLQLGQVVFNSIHAPWVQDIAHTLVSKSWEILNRITCDPSFARVVKSITVVSFSEGMSIFERMTLSNALTLLPNLKTFRWTGTYPDFDGTVASHLPSTLQRLELQASLPLTSLKQLTHLKSLHLSIPWFFPDDEEAHDGWTSFDDIIEVSSAQPSSNLFTTLGTDLTSLRLPASQCSSIPVRILNALLELEVIFLGSEGEAADGSDELQRIDFDFLFRHAMSLQSLTWLGHIDHRAYGFLPPFSSSSSSNSTLLRHLTSFRLSTSNIQVLQPPPTLAHLAPLLYFLSSRPLRRLYIRIPDLAWPLGLELWSLAHGLPKLEVLGLHTGYGAIKEDDLEDILERMPSQLRALHIAFDCACGNLLRLVDTVSAMPKLTFIHLYGTVHRLPILLQDLADENPHLQTIGLNRALWDVERVGSDGDVNFNKWPRWKIKFCVKEDFVCEDDAWLFKYN